LLAQDFPDFEVVVCDNASSDNTASIIREYADRDSRVRPFFNETNLGQIENCNRVVRLSRGEYFRWIGVEDWLEPKYASRSVDALDADPGAIVATTYVSIHTSDGTIRHAEYEGELLESDRPERRFARMVWAFHAGDAVYDPLYSTMRRRVLLDTGLLRMMVKADRVLAADLSLRGRFVHLPEALAHRWKLTALNVQSEAIRRRYHPTRFDELPMGARAQLGALLSVIREAPLRRSQKLRCVISALCFYAKEAWKMRVRSVRQFRRQRLGLTRERLLRRRDRR
jgi:glycosyltransferase involved in cell wall biosynthesis